jgi:hypothetical protein
MGIGSLGWREQPRRTRQGFLARGQILGAFAQAKCGVYDGVGSVVCLLQYAKERFRRTDIGVHDRMQPAARAKLPGHFPDLPMQRPDVVSTTHMDATK